MRMIIDVPCFLTLSSSPMECGSNDFLPPSCLPVGAIKSNEPSVSVSLALDIPSLLSSLLDLPAAAGLPPLPDAICFCCVCFSYSSLLCISSSCRRYSSGGRCSMPDRLLGVTWNSFKPGCGTPYTLRVTSDFICAKRSFKRSRKASRRSHWMRMSKWSDECKMNSFDPGALLLMTQFSLSMLSSFLFTKHHLND